MEMKGTQNPPKVSWCPYCVSLSKPEEFCVPLFPYLKNGLMFKTSDSVKELLKEEMR